MEILSLLRAEFGRYTRFVDGLRSTAADLAAT